MLDLNRKKIKYSIVIPIQNEEGNIRILFDKLSKVMKKINENFEIIFIDDGSSDNSYERIKEICNLEKRVKVIKFRRNFGKSTSLLAGFKHSKGEIIITLDGDLQDDPEDLPKLLKAFEDNYDVICGWRKNRKDPFLTKRVPSRFYNYLAGMISGLGINDFSSPFKVYKGEVAKRINLYGELHRYIPAMLNWEGYKIGEVEVKHHSRVWGKSKYGCLRLVKGFLDLIGVYFIHKFLSRPIHFFGSLGLILMASGTLTGIYLIFTKYFYGISLSERPLLLLAILLVLTGIQLITLGLIGEIIVKYRYEDKNENLFDIKEKINLD